MLWPINYIEYKRSRPVGFLQVALRKVILPWVQFVPFWQLRNLIWRVCGANLHPTVWIARNALLDEETLELITIDEGVRISYGSMLITHSDLDKEVGEIHIGRQAWVGAGTIILPGVMVGAYSVVGAGSLVNRDVPEDTRVAGVPARVIKPYGVPREWIHVTDRNYDKFAGAPAARQNALEGRPVLHECAYGQPGVSEHPSEEAPVTP